MSKELLSLVRSLHTQNKSSLLRFYKKNRIIGAIYRESLKHVSRSSRFFKFVERLYNFNQYSIVTFFKNNEYIQYMFTECMLELANVLNPVDKKKKAALLIGINYKGTENELRGCENDIRNTKEILKQKCGFKEENILVLMECLGPRSQPTRENIMRGIEWLVEKGNEGYGSLWFQYSGHGTYINDCNGDEMDGRDECLVTGNNKLVTDDEFRFFLISRIRKECQLFCLMDCCHSGSIMDLKYKYRSGEREMVIENPNQAECQVVALSGCRDDQTSADAWLSGSWCGALTKTFLDVLRQNKYNICLFDMVDQIRYRLQKGKFTQIPQLTSNKGLNRHCRF